MSEYRIITQRLLVHLYRESVEVSLRKKRLEMDYLSVLRISDKCSNWQTIISKTDQIFFRSGKNSKTVSVDMCWLKANIIFPST